MSMYVCKVFVQWHKKMILSEGADGAEGSSGREADHVGGSGGMLPHKILKFESF